MANRTTNSSFQLHDLDSWRILSCLIISLLLLLLQGPINVSAQANQVRYYYYPFLFSSIRRRIVMLMLFARDIVWSNSISSYPSRNKKIKHIKRCLLFLSLEKKKEHSKEFTCWMFSMDLWLVSQITITITIIIIFVQLPLLLRIMMKWTTKVRFPFSIARRRKYFQIVHLDIYDEESELNDESSSSTMKPTSLSKLMPNITARLPIEPEEVAKSEYDDEQDSYSNDEHSDDETTNPDYSQSFDDTDSIKHPEINSINNPDKNRKDLNTYPTSRLPFGPANLWRDLFSKPGILVGMSSSFFDHEKNALRNLPCRYCRRGGDRDVICYITCYVYNLSNAEERWRFLCIGRRTTEVSLACLYPRFISRIFRLRLRLIYINVSLTSSSSSRFLFENISALNSTSIPHLEKVFFIRRNFVFLFIFCFDCIL